MASSEDAAQSQIEIQESQSQSQTQILLAVKQSSIKGYPHPSISSKWALHWVLSKLIHPSSAHLFKLFILHVQVPDEDDYDDTAEDLKDMKRKEKTRGIHLLDEFVDRCNKFGVACEALVKKGNPKEVICKEALRVHSDMVVVGRRGLSALDRLFVGSVSEYCSKHAECPVLVIRRKQEDTPDDPLDD